MHDLPVKTGDGDCIQQQGSDDDRQVHGNVSTPIDQIDCLSSHNPGGFDITPIEWDAVATVVLQPPLPPPARMAVATEK